MKQDRQYLKSAAILSLGGLCAKFVGALYRVSLSNLLGGYGMGLYQMAYPLFLVLLTFSSAGIPSAFSKTIARETARGGTGTLSLKAALRLFALIGLGGTAAMCLFAPRMSLLQGESGLVKCYLYLAPSVFLVALIAVLRGYFQGKHDMRPTAISEILEQLTKTALALFFVSHFGKSASEKVALCLLAVTLSEGAALFYLFRRAKYEPAEKTLKKGKRSSEIFFSALPVMAAASLLPLSQTIDSVMIVRLLKGEGAVSLYGLFSGSALSLINLPASLSTGLAAAAVPTLAKSYAQGKREEGRERAKKALLFSFLLSFPCAIGLFFFARPITLILYPNLGAGEREILCSLLKLLAFSSSALAGTDVLASCLVGMERSSRAALAMLCAVAVKFVLQLILIPAYSIFGAAIAANACYLVAFFLDLFYTLRKKQRECDVDIDRARSRAARRLARRAPSASGGGRCDRPYGRTHSGDLQ